MNEGTQIHPMHLHGMPQLVIAKDGYPLANPSIEDTVTVAPGERYTVLVTPPSPGTWVWHCHILPHAENDNGMFGMVTALVVKIERRMSSRWRDRRVHIAATSTVDCLRDLFCAGSAPGGDPAELHNRGLRQDMNCLRCRRSTDRMTRNANP